MRTEEASEGMHPRLSRLAAERGPDTEDSTDDRPDTALSRWLPESGPEPAGGPRGWLATVRADPGRAGVTALAAVGIAAVLVTVFALMRDTPPPVSSAKLPPVQMVSSAGPTPSAAPNADEPVVVSVVGLVNKPGLVTLSSGARIADALTAAGGAAGGADLIGLNMARRVTDGEQIIVGIAPPPGEPATMGSSVGGSPGGSTGGEASPAPSTPAPPGTTATGAVDLNAATAEELDKLPGVGPMTAAAIIAWRAANGRFGSIDQLGDVDGIGPARLEKLRALVRV